jgi:Na+-transporting NADH:ubiquinone oxidoreductase subunit D
MLNRNQPSCQPCGFKGLCQGRGTLTLKDGLWSNNPVAVQILGICSALAVTNRLENSLVMGAALVFVCVCSNLFVSLLRKLVPFRIRMLAEVAIIATFVIIFDEFLKAFYWDMSKQLGPYVGLIITNCIIMGRAEAFAMQNPPILAVVDGAANGLGYAAVLVVIGFFRELLGTGQLMGLTVLDSRWYAPNHLMLLAPGAFLTLGIAVAVFNMLKGPPPEARKS